MNKEDLLQQKIVVWYRNNFQIHGKGLIFAIPNGGSRNMIEAKKLKTTGLMAGVSDLIVLQGNKTYFIELKTDIGRQSDEQKKFEERVTNLGFEYKIFRNEKDFQEYFNNTPTINRS
jgi:hypothetical protein